MFIIYRQEVRPFTDKQIALLQNFAAQAVIAIENARLITETREALERQTATAEVLGVINSSPGDLRPVFEAMVERAVRLCAADEALVRTFDGERLHLAAVHGAPGEAETLRQLGPAQLSGMYEFLARGHSVSHVADVRETAAYQMPLGRARLDARHVRSWLGVALRKDGALLGVINVHRREVRPFSEKQIGLLQNFAAQAVIAMENARLLTETREALEQQTATAEVLGVINAHPGDLAPVFEALMDRATRLCEAAFGDLWIYDGTKFRMAAVRGAPPEFAEFLARAPETAGSAAHRRLLAGDRLVHVPDLTNDEAYRSGNPMRRAVVELGGARTLLAIPLHKETTLLGVFSVFRQEVRPFTDKQIALVENFAAQAVIAIENTRLITETREALEQQTATAEVLGVINSSPGDLAPVFDAMLEKAMRLCDAETAHLLRFDGTYFSRAASFGVPPGFDEILPLGQPMADIINKDSVPYRMLRVRRTIPMLDLREDDFVRLGAPAETQAVAEGIRSVLFVPLLREGEVVGCFVMHRMVVRAFTDKEIALVENFAAQAVIAMENARLITETREALEQQTATAEVLQVINSSPGDLAPVFDAMLEKAMRLCEANLGFLLTYDGDLLQATAIRLASPEVPRTPAGALSAAAGQGAVATPAPGRALRACG